MPAYNLVCRSGKWNLVHKEIEHSMGSMVDDRDGRVYKTTTIDINGVTQTWMAENLRYDGGEGTSCGDDGCNYNFLDAMGLDSSYFIFDYAYESYEACVDSFRNVGILFEMLFRSLMVVLKSIVRRLWPIRGSNLIRLRWI